MVGTNMMGIAANSAGLSTTAMGINDLNSTVGVLNMVSTSPAFLSALQNQISANSNAIGA